MVKNNIQQTTNNKQQTTNNKQQKRTKEIKRIYALFSYRTLYPRLSYILYTAGKIRQNNNHSRKNIYNQINHIHVNHSYTYTYNRFFIIDSYK